MKKPTTHLITFFHVPQDSSTSASQYSSDNNAEQYQDQSAQPTGDRNEVLVASKRKRDDVFDDEKPTKKASKPAKSEKRHKKKHKKDKKEKKMKQKKHKKR